MILSNTWKKAKMRSSGRYVGNGLRLLAVAMIVSSGVTGAPHMSFAQSTVVSPAIDTSLFKDGTVQERELKFGNWFLRCQEIVKLQRRNCNLLSAMIDKKGEQRGSILMATDEKGQPGIMVALTLPVRLDTPVVVRSSFSVTSTKKPKKTIKVEYANKVIPTICDPSCKYLFAADPKLLFALNEGAEVEFEATQVNLTELTWLSLVGKGEALSLAVRGEGFADAVKASTERW
jgi:invasion protein IalB